VTFNLWPWNSTGFCSRRNTRSCKISWNSISRFMCCHVTTEKKHKNLATMLKTILSLVSWTVINYDNNLEILLVLTLIEHWNPLQEFIQYPTSRLTHKQTVWLSSQTVTCRTCNSVVSRCKIWCLAEGLRKRRSAPPYGPQGSGRTLHFLDCRNGLQRLRWRIDSTSGTVG